MAQTISIKGDANFVALDAFMERQLNAKGYKRLERKGSTSWIDPRITPADAAVRFKLCYFGPDDITFGVREDFVTDSGLTAATIGCPDNFTVQPSTVKFVGFIVTNDATGGMRLTTVLGYFP
ncbi:MAG TPA: hypothetical protein VFE62_13525 [Gemmataceae bacterium]|nr:hypothetical protein [Gemmataceae bacterium]